MAVFFVYRSHYDNPGCKHVRTFEADSVLKWFRKIWAPISDEAAARDHAEKLIGRHVYSLDSLFTFVAEQELDPPSSMDELASILQSCLYTAEMHHGPHHLEILTDDDELEMAVYVFDEKFTAKYPGRVAFLTREDWRLPGGAADGEFKAKAKFPVHKAGDGPGVTYFAPLACYDSGNLSDLADFDENRVRIDGVRLPDLARYLLRSAEPPAKGELELLAKTLRTLADQTTGDEGALLKGAVADPGSDAAWSAYSDWLEERGKPPAGLHLLDRALRACGPADPGHDTSSRDPGKDEVLVQPHVAQACLHTANWGSPGDLFHHWIFFDDLWAAAHPDLANSVLRFASRWDVLGAGKGAS